MIRQGFRRYFIVSPVSLLRNPKDDFTTESQRHVDQETKLFSHPMPLGSLTLDELSKHLLGIDRNEDTLTARQDFSGFVEDFGGIHMLTAMHGDFPAFDAQGRLQRHGLEIFHCHFFRHGNNIAQFVGLSHGVVEDGCDDSSMAMAWRSCVTLGKTEVANESPAFFVKRELQLHPLRIIGAAGEAKVLGGFNVMRLVTVRLAGHGEIKPQPQRHRGRRVLIDQEILYTYPFCVLSGLSHAVDICIDPSAQKKRLRMTNQF